MSVLQLSQMIILTFKALLSKLNVSVTIKSNDHFDIQSNT